MMCIIPVICKLKIRSKNRAAKAKICNIDMKIAYIWCFSQAHFPSSGSEDHNLHLQFELKLSSNCVAHVPIPFSFVLQKVILNIHFKVSRYAFFGPNPIHPFKRR